MPEDTAEHRYEARCSIWTRSAPPSIRKRAASPLNMRGTPSAFCHCAPRASTWRSSRAQEPPILVAAHRPAQRTAGHPHGGLYLEGRWTDGDGLRCCRARRARRANQRRNARRRRRAGAVSVALPRADSRDVLTVTGTPTAPDTTLTRLMPPGKCSALRDRATAVARISACPKVFTAETQRAPRAAGD